MRHTGPAVRRSRHLLRLTVASALLLGGVACSGHGGAAVHGAAGAADPVLGSPGDRLLITTDGGLRLRPADGRRAVVDDRAERRWSHRDGSWVLDLSCDDRFRDAGRCPRMPLVLVPADVGVTVTARNAGIDVAGVTAALDLTTVNGDVTVARSGQAAAAVKLATRNGSVRAAALDAGRVSARTVNGDVELTCSAPPSAVTATTTNGSVGVTVPPGGPAYRVTATTDNGRTRIGIPTGGTGRAPTVHLATVNGDVEAHTG